MDGLQRKLVPGRQPCYKRLGLQTFPGIQHEAMTDVQYQLPYPDIENELGQRQ